MLQINLSLRNIELKYFNFFFKKRNKLHNNLSDERIKSLHGSIFPTFINYLVQFSLNQSPRICYAPPLTEETVNIIRNQYPSCNISIGNLKQIQIVDSTWTACLLQLYHVKVR